MDKKLSFGKIAEKIDDITLEGQGCRNDCKRDRWSGSAKMLHMVTACKKTIIIDSFVTVLF